HSGIPKSRAPWMKSRVNRPLPSRGPPTHENGRYGKLEDGRGGYRSGVTRAALVLGLASTLLLSAFAPAQDGSPGLAGREDSALAVAPTRRLFHRLHNALWKC